MEWLWMPTLAKFILILTRVGGTFLSTPVFSSGGFLTKPKVLFAILLTVVLFPVIQITPPAGFWRPSVFRSARPLPTVLWSRRRCLPPIPTLAGFWRPSVFVLLVLSELAVGMLMGMVFNFIFAGIQLAGHVMGFEIGFSLVRSIDPLTNVETVVMSVLWNLIALVLFMTINGHHLIIQTFIHSYQVMPVGTFSLNHNGVMLLMSLSGSIFVIGVQLAAPVLVVVGIVDIIIGLIGRAAPQVQILLIAFPLKILTGLFAAGLSLYFMPSFMQSAVQHAVHNINTLLSLMK